MAKIQFVSISAHPSLSDAQLVTLKSLKTYNLIYPAWLWDYKQTVKMHKTVSNVLEMFCQNRKTNLSTDRFHS